MIAGLIAPTSGEASVAGVPLTSRTIDRVRSTWASSPKRRASGSA